MRFCSETLVSTWQTPFRVAPEPVSLDAKQPKIDRILHYRFLYIWFILNLTYSNESWVENTTLGVQLIIVFVMRSAGVSKCLINLFGNPAFISQKNSRQQWSFWISHSTKLQSQSTPSSVSDSVWRCCRSLIFRVSSSWDIRNSLCWLMLYFWFERALLVSLL